MSLQVWLPLDKDLKNVGTKNITATKNSSSVVIQNDTDFGNVLYFGAASTNGCIYFPPEEFTGNTAMSVSFYVNFLTFDADYSNLVGFFNSATASDIYDANKIFSFYKHVNTTGTTAQFRFFVSVSTSNYILTNSFSTNTWQHFVLVNKGKNLILYQNGAKINEITVSSNLPYNLIKRVTFGQSNSSNNTRHCNAKISDLRIYDHALSEYDVQRIYQNRNTHEIPTVPDSPVPDLPLWVKILHHNHPDTNLFTTANAKKNTTENLYSRLGIYFNSTIFKNPYGKYEFLAKEKLESGSTEQSYQWRQTSSPTASTIAGFEKIKNTNNSERLIGLKSTNSYATFHNGSAWWCACGSYTAYQGGIPGFGDIVKSGYLDLYAKARIGHLPNDYEELEYITFNGTHYFYIDKPQGQKSSMKIEFYIEPDTLDHSQPTFFGGVNSRVQFYRPNATNLNLWTSSGSMGFGTFNAGQKNSLIVDLTASSVKSRLNGRAEVTTTNTDAFNKLFSQSCTKFTVGAYNLNYYPFYGNLYELKIYTDNVLLFSGIPARRKSDNIIGMYDIVSKKFFTNQGTGVFDAGPSAISLPKEYEKLEYIEGTGTQYINTTYPYNSSINTYRIECDWQFTGVNTNYQAPYGAYVGENNACFRIIRGNSNTVLWTYSHSKAGGGVRHTLNGDIFQRFKTIHTCTYVTYNGVKYALTNATSGNASTSTFYVMAQGVNSCVSKIKMWYFKIFESDILKLCLIPAKRKSDNVIGMYDIVSGQFFTNSGTGSFTGA